MLLSQADLKKIALTTCLKRYIDAIDQNYETQIIQRNACERLFQGIPEQIQLDGAKQIQNLRSQPQVSRNPLGAMNKPAAPSQMAKPIPYLVADFFSSWPSFTNVLYCSLDYQIVILFIMGFSLFDRVTGSTLVAVAIMYLVEKTLETVRAWLSENNLSKKTLIDDRFLI